MRAWLRASLLVSLLHAVGCPGGASTTKEPVAVCTKENEACAFAPGKIGICVASMQACARPPCLECMSQH